jgi:hypothetical protein
MASTNFVDNSTVIYAAWLNDVNNAVYNGIFAASSISPANLVCNGSVSGTGFTGLVNNTLSSPGPIGSGTPNTGKFTTLQATSLTGLTTALSVGQGGTGLTAVGTSGNVLTSNGSVWVSQAPVTIKGLGYGGETWHTVTGSRSNGTTYNNSYSYPISVQIYSTGAGANSDGTLTVGGVLVSQVHGDTTNGGASSTLSAIVPPGVTYVLGGSRGIGFWVELY